MGVALGGAMSLQCQKDSYALTHTCKVLSCVPVTINKAECYEITLEDTVFFPEGGGQPDDRGKINDIEVIGVERRGGSAIHYTTQPLTQGNEVSMEIDWTRRFDHMQQHSGQHLITAITDQMYGIKTTSWNLAIGSDNKCHVELNTKVLSQQQIQSIEDKCNESIRRRVSMTPRWLEPDSKELEEVRSRGLPDDVVGLVRVVDIEGIDSNMCCGTHVSNLSDIQCIKLLHTENKRGSTILYYVAGNRVLDYLSKCTKVERELTKLLSTGLDEHTEAVDRALKTQKQSAKLIRNQLREIAQLIVYKHVNAVQVDPVAIVHKDEGDNEFMNTIASELTQHDVFVFVTVGGDKGAGQFLLAGKETLVNDIGPRIASVMEGRGGGRKGRFQGKANKIQNRSQAELIIRETINA